MREREREKERLTESSRKKIGCFSCGSVNVTQTIKRVNEKGRAWKEVKMCSVLRDPPMGFVGRKQVMGIVGKRKSVYIYTIYIYIQSGGFYFPLLGFWMLFSFSSFFGRTWLRVFGLVQLLLVCESDVRMLRCLVSSFVLVGLSHMRLLLVWSSSFSPWPTHHDFSKSTTVSRIKIWSTLKRFSTIMGI